LFPDDLAAYGTSVMRLTKRNIPSGVFVIVHGHGETVGTAQSHEDLIKI
jgi:hypothetical protein